MIYHDSAEKFIQNYGKEAMYELLDLYVFTTKRADERWRRFAIKHKIIRPTTKTVVKTSYKQPRTTERVRTEAGICVNMPTEPHDHYALQLKNGRNQVVLSLNFKSTELQELLGVSI